MAMLVSGWVLAKGFKCTSPLLGLSNEIRKAPDRFRDAAQYKENWAALIAHSFDKALQAELTIIQDIPALRQTLKALCPSVRSSSSISRAIDFIIGCPVFSAKAFTENMKLTPRGAKDVLDRLGEANIIEVEGGLRNRLFVCRRTM